MFSRSMTAVVLTAALLLPSVQATAQTAGAAVDPAAQPQPQPPQPEPRRRGFGLGGLGAAIMGVGAAPAPAAMAQGGGCPGAQGPSVAGALASSIGGALLNRGLSRVNVPYDFGIRSTVHAVLVDKIACLLSPQERQQAAEATEQAVERGVGATARWESRDRPGVTGMSVVASEQAQGNGGICRVVNDVVIVEGEETTVQKRMCRAPGATGFTLQT